ncbi:MAG: hypothetical protein OXN96_16690 [Bryobacterales bacterium]|nr:hypothetical protein [Bryobacterales bacterium]MDE0622957.1 hypothetical protein [Bryobacterales bacterium]
MDETRAVYDAMMSHIDAMLECLDHYFGEELPAVAHRLYFMPLSPVEVATLVELYKRPESVSARDPLRFVSRD